MKLLLLLYLCVEKKNARSGGTLSLTLSLSVSLSFSLSQLSNSLCNLSSLKT